MKKTIKIKYIDFWKGFEPNNFIVTKILKRKYNVEICEDADYIFYSSFGLTHLDAPEKCIKVFFTGENECPDFNLCDYAISFEWLEFGDRHFRLPVYYCLDKYIEKTLLMENKHILNNDYDLNIQKSAFCSFVVSNPNGDPIRSELFDIISGYKVVNSGGKYLNNTGYFVENKLSFDSQHKFTIACENAQHNGYTTEKIVEAFAAQTIPIYWGDPNIEKVFNSKAFINVSKFNTFQALIDEIKRIDNDDSVYMNMLSQPALIDNKYSMEIQLKKLTDFLENIVEQPIEKAQRRSRVFWQNSYLVERIIMRNNKNKDKYYYLKKIFKLEWFN